MEEWRVVPGYPAYQVSNLGRVRSHWKRVGTRQNLRMVAGEKWRLLKQAVLPTGHRHVTLGDGHGGQRTFLIAVLVLMAFVRVPEPGEWALHTHNPDPADNRPENLRWGTPVDNQADIVRHHGRHHNAKLTPAQAEEIRGLVGTGMEQKEIARRFGVCRSLVTMIKNGKCHRRVA